MQTRMELHVNSHRLLLFTYFDFIHKKKKKNDESMKDSNSRPQIASGNYWNMIYVMLQKAINLKQT